MSLHEPLRWGLCLCVEMICLKVSKSTNGKWCMLVCSLTYCLKQTLGPLMSANAYESYFWHFLVVCVFWQMPVARWSWKLNYHVFVSFRNLTRSANHVWVATDLVSSSPNMTRSLTSHVTRRLFKSSFRELSRWVIAVNTTITQVTGPSLFKGRQGEPCRNVVEEHLHLMKARGTLPKRRGRTTWAG